MEQIIYTEAIKNWKPKPKRGPIPAPPKPQPPTEDDRLVILTLPKGF